MTVRKKKFGSSTLYMCNVKDIVKFCDEIETVSRFIGYVTGHNAWISKPSYVLLSTPANVAFDGEKYSAEVTEWVKSFPDTNQYQMCISSL